MSWPKEKKKNPCLEVLSSLTLLNNNEPFLKSDCDVWWEVGFIPQLVTISSVVRPRSSSKMLPKVKLAPEKGHGHCLVVCCLPDPLQLSKSRWSHYIWIMLSKSMRCTENCQCLQLALVKIKGPILSPWQCLSTCHTTSTSKVERTGLWSSTSSTIFTWPLANQYHSFKPSQQLFAGKMFPQQVGRRKRLPQVR